MDGANLEQLIEDLSGENDEDGDAISQLNEVPISSSVPPPVPLSRASDDAISELSEVPISSSVPPPVPLSRASDDAISELSEVPVPSSVPPPVPQYAEPVSQSPGRAVPPPPIDNLPPLPVSLKLEISDAFNSDDDGDSNIGSVFTALPKIIGTITEETSSQVGHLIDEQGEEMIPLPPTYYVNRDPGATVSPPSNETDVSSASGESSVSTHMVSGGALPPPMRSGLHSQPWVTSPKTYTSGFSVNSDHSSLLHNLSGNPDDQLSQRSRPQTVLPPDSNNSTTSDAICAKYILSVTGGDEKVSSPETNESRISTNSKAITMDAKEGVNLIAAYQTSQDYIAKLVRKNKEINIEIANIDAVITREEFTIALAYKASEGVRTREEIESSLKRQYDRVRKNKKYKKDKQQRIKKNNREVEKLRIDSAKIIEKLNSNHVTIRGLKKSNGLAHYFLAPIVTSHGYSFDEDIDYLSDDDDSVYYYVSYEPNVIEHEEIVELVKSYQLLQNYMIDADCINNDNRKTIDEKTELTKKIHDCLVLQYKNQQGIDAVEFLKSQQHQTDKIKIEILNIEIAKQSIIDNNKLIKQYKEKLSKIILTLALNGLTIIGTNDSQSAYANYSLVPIVVDNVKAFFDKYMDANDDDSELDELDDIDELDALGQLVREHVKVNNGLGTDDDELTRST